MWVGKLDAKCVVDKDGESLYYLLEINDSRFKLSMEQFDKLEYLVTTAWMGSGVTEEQLQL